MVEIAIETRRVVSAGLRLVGKRTVDEGTDTLPEQAAEMVASTAIMILVSYTDHLLPLASSLHVRLNP